MDKGFNEALVKRVLEEMDKGENPDHTDIRDLIDAMKEAPHPEHKPLLSESLVTVTNALLKLEPAERTRVIVAVSYLLDVVVER